MAEKHSDCYICQKHRGENKVPGGAIYEDELVYVGHASIPQGQNSTYLGAVLIEPKRHLDGLAELNDEEAQRVGLLAAYLSRALKVNEGAEHVYQFVLGHHVAHLHVWVVPRYPGTPREYWGLRVDEWPDAPKGGAQEIADLCGRIRRYLESRWPHQ